MPRRRFILFLVTAFISAGAAGALAQPGGLRRLPPVRVADRMVDEPGLLSPPISEAASAMPAELEPATRLPLTLADVEAMAVDTSPSIRALQARVTAARWECVQAGLPPNPTAGYTAGEIGNDGAAGQHGAYVGQQFIRGGKLGYAQAVAAKEARRREQQLAAERQRVLTDVRTVFYEVFLASREVTLTRRLTGLSSRAAETSQALLEAGEGRRTDVLQAEIENRRADAAQRAATQRLDAAWRRLAALVDLPAGAPQPVSADPEQLIRHAGWNELVDRVLSASPEVSTWVAAIEKARCEVARERSQVVPDVTAQVSVQYDYGAQDTIAGVQIGMPLPLWNRNQGSIGRACSELTAARRSLEATEQSIVRRLAQVYGDNQAALALAETLGAEVLPRAEESLTLATDGYQAGELAFLDLLTAQRTYFQVNLEYLAALRELNQSSQLLEGQLLSGSANMTME